jgi:hypothetical protein
MRFSIDACVATIFFLALPVVAQQPAKGPHPKNQQELAALQKVQAATTPDDQLAAINNVLENFTDTDYKPMLLSMAMQAAQQKDDMAVIETWVQRAEEADPNSIEAHVVLAEAAARHTRENDLDKADSIKKIQTNANKALDLLKTANAPPAGIPDAQWPEIKKQLMGESYDALGQAAALDKNFADAVTSYKAGVAADPAASVLKARLAKAFVDNKQYDDAISTADQVIADNTAQPVVKQFATQQKDAATKLKGAK